MFGLEITGLFGLIWFIIILWAIIKVAQSGAGALSKAIWIVVLLFLPVIGLLAWLIFGPRG
ncbi:PLDc N-terminal domain-containing protein [Pyruvatibacter sp.]|uniref:PLDc N-terminal domain-containing protein n=1 Tax=Pyruvatibacter sp. TaxID=1981328 RepID=UPI0032EF0E09